MSLTIDEIRAEDEANKQETEIIWKALKGSQTMFLNCPYSEVLLHGSRGGGKSEVALMAFLKGVGKGYGHRWKGVIFRRKYKEFDDIISKSKRLFYRLYPKGTANEARYLAGKGDYKWIFPDGETLLFRKMDCIDDYDGFHGQEFPFILWEELTNWPTDELYEKTKSVNRTVLDLDVNGKPIEGSGRDDIPIVYLSTTNPSGAGHGWVKSYFIDAGDNYQPIYNKFGEARCHIPSSVWENPFMSEKYVRGLCAIKDKNLRKAWLQGSWDIVAGGMFSDVWDIPSQIVEPFEIPKSWKIDRSLDWGTAKPYSVIWYAESDGTDYVDERGDEISTVRGDIFCILELYGGHLGKNKGVFETGREAAIKIRDMEMNHPLLKGRNVRKGPADNSIWTTEQGQNCASNMAVMGIYWARSDKSAGSRAAGWEVIRQKLKNTHNGSGEPSLRFFPKQYCPSLIALLPTCPRDDDKDGDIDTDSEDHSLDSLRYRCRKLRAHNGSRSL